MAIITSPRASARSYDTVPLSWPNTEEWMRLLAESIQGILDGKINATGTVTLTANSATSTLADRRIGPDSAIFFMPTTANAATEFGAGTLQVSSRGKQTATLTHVNNAETDRTFGYVVLG